VRRKGDKVFDSIKAGDGVDSIVVVDENVEEQGVVDGLKLLANEEFDKECDDCGHERKVSKKRKASRKLHSPKYVWYSICDIIVMLMLFILQFRVIFIISCWFRRQYLFISHNESDKQPENPIKLGLTHNVLKPNSMFALGCYAFRSCVYQRSDHCFYTDFTGSIL